MTISKENYEAWMLDYLEGKLLGKQLATFESFLSEHPELRDAAEGVEKITLTEDEKFFGDKSMLKAKMLKQVIDEEEQTCFEAVEGTLTNDKKTRLEKRVEGSSRLKQKLEQYHEARLMPDYKLVYPNKAGLKRTEPIGRKINPWLYLAVAASLAGIIYLAIPSESSDADLVKRPALSQLPKTTNQGAKKPIKQPIGTMVKDTKPEAKPKSVPAQKVTESSVVQVVGQSRVPATLVSKVPVRKVNQPRKQEQPWIETPAVVKERYAEQTKPAVSVKPVVTKAPTKPTNQPPEGTQPNGNFVYSESMTASAAPLTNSPIIKVGTRILEKVSGDRLSIKLNKNNSAKVNFESKLLSFETNINR